MLPTGLEHKEPPAASPDTKEAPSAPESLCVPLGSRAASQDTISRQRLGHQENPENPTCTAGHHLLHPHDPDVVWATPQKPRSTRWRPRQGVCAGNTSGRTLEQGPGSS